GLHRLVFGIRQMVNATVMMGMIWTAQEFVKKKVGGGGKFTSSQNSQQKANEKSGTEQSLTNKNSAANSSSKNKTNEKSGTELSLTDKNSVANSFLKNTQGSTDYLYNRLQYMVGR
ncbi:MAG: hypothetical protein IKW67_00015, partial [Alphaproteobacteria bacterium]|nr:hypothetical protein [Alphaproteobacteria bacterium]